MDKKNTVIGVLLLAAAFVIIYLTPKPQPPASKPVAPAAATTSAASANPASTATNPVSAGVDAAAARTVRDPASATITTLANDYVAVNFSDLGGAIRDVALKKYPREQGKPD